MNTDTETPHPIDRVESWVQNGLLERVEGFIDARRAYWERHPDAQPGPDDVKRLINRSALRNASISGAATAVPGAIGLATIPAEILLSLNTLVSLAYDIALAHGKADQADLSSILAVVTEDATLAGRLLVHDEGRRVVRRPTRRVLAKAVDLVAKQAAKRFARLILGRLVPVIGAGAAAWWARGAARRVGKRADDLFGGDLEIVDASPADEAAFEEALEGVLPESTEPQSLDEPDHLVAARYELLADVAGEEASTAQKDVLEDLYQDATTRGVPVDPPEKARTRPRTTDLSVFAGRDPAVLFAAVAAFGKLGSGVPTDWAYRIGAAFGLDEEAVDELLLDAPGPDDQVWFDA